VVTSDPTAQDPGSAIGPGGSGANNAIQAGQVSDHVTGNGTLHEQDQGSDSLDLHETWQVANNASTLTSITADLSTDDTFGEQDSGTAQDAQTGNGSSDHLSEDYGDNVSGTDHTQMHLTGAGDNFSETVDEQEQD